jgi:hypothetical protein
MLCHSHNFLVLAQIAALSSKLLLLKDKDEHNPLFWTEEERTRRRDRGKEEMCEKDEEMKEMIPLWPITGFATSEVAVIFFV